MSRSYVGALTPAKIILGGFFLIILLGALLLMLPISSKSGEVTPFVEALFTATTATCVTGLVVHDTFSYWSSFGHGVILTLIQIGGLGVITTAVSFFLLTGKKIGLKERYTLQESISAPQMGGIVRMTTFILRAVLLIEGLGAILFSFRFIPKFGLGRGIWFSIFHSVSAFCNAGIDLLGIEGPYSSVTNYTGDIIVNFAIMSLIVIGGLGFFVWDDICKNKYHIHRYRLHTKVVLLTTFCLLVLPALYFFFVEFSGPAWQDLTLKEKILASMFQSVTPRTAGFNSVDLTKLSSPSVLLTICLMLIGGSPGSTAGGIKTTTLAVLFLSIRSVFSREDSLKCFKRRISVDIFKNAVAIFFMYLILFLVGGSLICMIDAVPLQSALFEVASALGTVGLSLSITPSLSSASQLILIALMYFGRVGCLTILYALSTKHQTPASKLPQESITVG